VLEGWVSLGQIASAAQLVSITTGLLSKNYNPTVDLILSVGSMLSAANMKLDAIYDRIELLHADIQNLRAEVEAVPLKTVEIEFGLTLRARAKKIARIMEDKDAYFGNQKGLFEDLFAATSKLETAVEDYIEVCRDNKFDGITHVILATDALYRAYLILMGFEATSHGIAIPVGRMVNTLQYSVDTVTDAVEDSRIGLAKLAVVAEENAATYQLPYAWFTRKIEADAVPLIVSSLIAQKKANVPNHKFTPEMYWNPRDNAYEHVIGADGKIQGSWSYSYNLLEIDSVAPALDAGSYGLKPLELLNDSKMTAISAEENDDTLWELGGGDKMTIVKKLTKIEDEYNALVARYYNVNLTLHSCRHFTTIMGRRLERRKEVYAA
jgi:hypothetical protein